MKTCFITGASSGLGEAFASYFASQKYNLILVSRRPEKLFEVANRLQHLYSVQVETVCADLALKSDQELITGLIKNTSDLEILINNAGFGKSAYFFESSLNEHLEMIAVHVSSVVSFSHAAIENMKINKKRGVIVNVSSLGAFFDFPGHTLYSATKMFLIRFSEGLSIEVKKIGISIQALCPGDLPPNFLPSGC